MPSLAADLQGAEGGGGGGGDRSLNWIVFFYTLLHGSLS